LALAFGSLDLEPVGAVAFAVRYKNAGSCSTNHTPKTCVDLEPVGAVAFAVRYKNAGSCSTNHTPKTCVVVSESVSV